jgi:hypothetical protein
MRQRMESLLSLLCSLLSPEQRHSWPPPRHVHNQLTSLSLASVTVLSLVHGKLRQPFHLLHGLRLHQQRRGCFGLRRSPPSHLSHHLSHRFFLSTDNRSTVCSRVIIVNNHTKTKLEYSSMGSHNGFFYTNINRVFENDFLPPKKVGAFVHSGKNMALFGSCGYVSVRIRSPGRNYIVCLGFSSDSAQKNRAGIQIRGEDGVTDNRGNVTGHGVDPTGRVDQIVDLTSHVHDGGSDLHKFNEECRCFKVSCQFTNNSTGIFTFTIDPVVE